MRFYNIQNKLVLTAILLVAALHSVAQLNTLSPYSRFGIGELEGGSSIYSNNIGNSTVGLTPFITVNYDNPASYSYLVAPLFQTSLNYNFTQVESNESSSQVSNSSFKEIILGAPSAPFGKRWGMAVGFVPYSNVGYDFSERSQLLADSTQASFEYKGNGGFSKAFIGFGRRGTNYDYQVFDRGPEIGMDSVKYMNTALSVGLNLYNVFGSVEYERNVFFDDFSSYYHRLESTSTSIAKGGTTLGFIFKKNLKTNFVMKGVDVKKTKQVHLHLAGTFDTFFGKVGSENSSQILNAYTQSSTLATLAVDTISLAENIEGELAIPYTFTIGGALTFLNAKQNYLEVSAQYQSQDWSNFSNSLSNATPNLYGPSNRLSVGLQYTPKPIDDDKANFLKRTLYQIGFSQNQNYLNLNGENISENRVGLGCSIPFLKSRSLSRLNLGMDFGIRGSTNNGLIKESSVNAYIGFSLVPNLKIDRWFQKSKYQ